MANLIESSQWVEGIYQIEEDDPVMGGADGVDNRPHKELAARTTFLKDEVDTLKERFNSMDTVEGHNSSLDAHDGILHLRKPNTAYAVGDIAYSPDLPSWARLECVKAGTTASPDIAIPNTIQAGILITDGAVTWIIDDIRDCTAVGDTVGKLYLPDGYVKANGATVLRADYPRLVNLADKYSLWTTDVVTYPSMFGEGDGSTTMLLPDWRGVVARYMDDGKGYDTNRILGTMQMDAIKSHTAPVGTGWALDDFDPTGGTYLVTADVSGYTYGSITAKYSGAAETRVKNIALIPQIKY